MKFIIEATDYEIAEWRALVQIARDAANDPSLMPMLEHRAFQKFSLTSGMACERLRDIVNRAKPVQ